MAALNFPDSPTLGQTYTANGKIWEWNGYAWLVKTSGLTVADIGTTVQPVDADLTAIAALSGTTGLLKKTAADTWSLDTTAYTTNTGTVTSVGITPGTGISVSGTPITGSGSITVTNSAPDQTVVLTQGGATTITGTYPNFTISSTDTNTTYSTATASVLGLVKLGSDTAQSVAANAVSTTASRSYAVQLNASGQAVVNVPWADATSTALVSNTDIGTAPNEVPLNQYLGDLAYQNEDQFVVRPQTSANPLGIGEMTFQLTNNTTLVVKVKGTDGTVRSNTWTLA